MLNLLQALGSLNDSRIIIHNAEVSGESVGADVKASEESLETLDKLIVEENYLPEFQYGQNLPILKGMPERTFIHKETKSLPGFKALKDRMTVLPGGNASGYKLKETLCDLAQ